MLSKPINRDRQPCVLLGFTLGSKKEKGVTHYLFVFLYFFHSLYLFMTNQDVYTTTNGTLLPII